MKQGCRRKCCGRLQNLYEPAIPAAAQDLCSGGLHVAHVCTFGLSSMIKGLPWDNHSVTELVPVVAYRKLCTGVLPAIRNFCGRITCNTEVSWNWVESLYCQQTTRIPSISAKALSATVDNRERLVNAAEFYGRISAPYHRRDLAGASSQAQAGDRRSSAG